MSEKKERKELLLSAYKYVSSITSEMHGRYAVYFGIILVNQALTTTLAVLIGKSIDVETGVITRFSFNQLLWAVFIVAILRCAGAILDSVYHVRKIVYDIDTLIKQHSLTKLLRFSPGQTNRENTGFKQSTLEKGTEAIAEMINLLASTITPTVLRIITATAILFYIDWMIGASVLVVVILFTLASAWVNNSYVDTMKIARGMESDLETKFWEIMKHLRLVIMTGSQDKVYEKFFSDQDSAWNYGKRVWTKYNIQTGTLRNLPFDHLVQAPFLALIFYLVREQRITIGDTAIIITLIANVYGSLASVGTIQRSLLRYSINIMRFRNMVEQPVECADVDDPIELKHPKGRIQFEDVKFAYDTKGVNALDGISFTIEPGETVAFVGTTGSGKSTIVSLLLRGHVPQSGTITVDDVPLSHIAINQWRQSIGVVSQQNTLWDTTVKENILFGVQRELGDVELRQIVSDTCIDEFRERLGPQGLDTVIGENGVMLSGGQCQRIAIARVLARDPRVIIFDEATSALDNYTESLVYAAMDRALLNRTGIIIAHRLGTVRKANRIIVLSKGRIVGQGTFEELSQSNEAFKQLIGSELR